MKNSIARVAIATAMISTPIAAGAVTFVDTVGIGNVGETPDTGAFQFDTTFSAFDSVIFRFAGGELGFAEDVRLVLGEQDFFIGTDSTRFNVSSTVTRTLILEDETFADLSDGSINFAVRVTSRGSFAGRATNASVRLTLDATEGPAISAVPVPAALPMALTAFGILGWATRRKAKA
ncbi:MAG: hypothetical protein ABJL99_16390 [Aliishimia sp.]